MKKQNSFFFLGSGGVNHEEANRGKIEALVLFSSKEVIQRNLTAFPYTKQPNPGQVRDEILANLKRVWKRKDIDEGRKIFWCELDIDNYQDCFDKILKVAYRFSPPGRQGKEIWCNLTGGGNGINLSLLAMAQLSGKSTKQYLLSQRREFQQEVTVPNIVTICPNKDDYFNSVPFLKTSIDTIGFYEILMEIEILNRPVSTPEIHQRIASKSQLFLDFDRFKKQYMLKLYGLGYTDYQLDTDLNQITESGKNFVNELNNLETAINLEKQLIQDNFDIVAESRNWDWFKEIDLLDV